MADFEQCPPRDGTIVIGAHSERHTPPWGGVVVETDEPA
jgi:hypothetical protein